MWCRSVFALFGAKRVPDAGNSVRVDFLHYTRDPGLLHSLGGGGAKLDGFVSVDRFSRIINYAREELIDFNRLNSTNVVVNLIRVRRSLRAKYMRKYVIVGGLRVYAISLSQCYNYDCLRFVIKNVLRTRKRKNTFYIFFSIIQSRY